MATRDSKPGVGGGNVAAKMQCREGLASRVSNVSRGVRQLHELGFVEETSGSEILLSATYRLCGARIRLNRGLLNGR